MRSLADTIIIMPTVESMTRTAYSNLAIPFSRALASDIKSAKAEPVSTNTFMKREKPSEMKPPLNSTPAVLPVATSRAMASSTMMAMLVSTTECSRLRKITPTSSSTMAARASRISGRTGPRALKLKRSDAMVASYLAAAAGAAAGVAAGAG